MNLTERDFSDNLSILTDFNEKCRVLAAFSGGSDSLALASLCSKVLGRDRTAAVYVNHCIREDSELEKEIELNRKNCRALGIDLSVIKLDKERLTELSTKIGIEAAARKMRYEKLEDFARTNGFDYIATAHHFDDQLETLLMKCITNAPLPAFRGIAWKKDNVIRPLLSYRKSQIENYLENLGLEWSTDSTNFDNSILRNNVRNLIIPSLSSVVPDWEQRLLNIMSKAFEEEKSEDPVSIYRLFEMWDEKFDFQMPQTLASRVRQAFLCGKTQNVSASGGTFLVGNGKVILVDDSEDEKFDKFVISIGSKPAFYTLLEGKTLVVTENFRDKKDLCIDFSKLQNPKVRYVKQGDRIRLKDSSKMVLKLLQDMKVPSVLRKRVPVLEDDSGICAVFGSSCGGHDRICRKLVSSLADCGLYVYIKNTDI